MKSGQMLQFILLWILRTLDNLLAWVCVQSDEIGTKLLLLVIRLISLLVNGLTILFV